MLLVVRMEETGHTEADLCILQGYFRVVVYETAGRRLKRNFPDCSLGICLVGKTGGCRSLFTTTVTMTIVPVSYMYLIY